MAAASAAIHVREGEQVAAGQPLITLDGEVARSERSELLGRLAAALRSRWRGWRPRQAGSRGCLRASAWQPPAPISSVPPSRLLLRGAQCRQASRRDGR